MPTMTYTNLATVKLTAATSSIIFDSVPFGFGDLIIVVQGTTSVSGNGRMRLNSDSGNNYSYVYMGGNGTTASSNTATLDNYARVSRDADTGASPLQMNINIMDYSATNKHKTILSRANNVVSGTEGLVSRWQSTAVVTTIEIFASAGTWDIGTTAILYGVVA